MEDTGPCKVAEKKEETALVDASRSQRKETDNMDIDAIRGCLGKVREYFFNDLRLEAEVQQFCKDRIDKIDLSSGEINGEQALHYTEMHRDFSLLFERRLSDAVDRYGDGVTLGQFMRFLGIVSDSLNEKQEKNTGAIIVDDDDRSFLETLFAIFDYEAFMILMRETKRGNKWTIDGMFSR
jgi:hypothetical protein